MPSTRKLRDTRYYANGVLTDYGLSCGYVELHEDYPYRITMWKEHGVFFVRTYDTIIKKQSYYKAFTKLYNARECYRYQKNKVKSLPRSPSERIVRANQK